MEIREPDPSGLIVRMTHIVAKNRAFAADLAYFCHRLTSNKNFILL